MKKLELQTTENFVIVDHEFIRDPGLSGNEKLLYIILKSYCGPGNMCYPSIRTVLTANTGLSARAIINILRSLENKGYIEIKKNKGPRGALTNVYILKKIKNQVN